MTLSVPVMLVWKIYRKVRYGYRLISVSEDRRIKGTASEKVLSLLILKILTYVCDIIGAPKKDVLCYQFGGGMENIYMKILKNIIITGFAMLAAATAICFILRPLVPTDTHVVNLFMCWQYFVYQTYRRIFLWGAGIYGGSCGSQLYLPIHIFKWILL